MRKPQARKSYGQFCALARSLDRVGDRWTLLIVRQLLLGPAGFGALREALPGIAKNLLAHRLVELETDGIIARSSHPQRSKAVRYELTKAGESLEPTVLDLIRWGAQFMTTGRGSDHADPNWILLALRALLANPMIVKPAGDLAIDVEGVEIIVSIGASGRSVSYGLTDRAKASIRAPLDQLLAYVSTNDKARHSRSLAITGNAAFAKAALKN